MRPLCFTFALVLIVSSASADVVTFGNQSIDHLDFAGAQTEGAFTYRATSGDGWEVESALGNHPSALATFYNGQSSSVGDTVDFTRVGGGSFTFRSLETAPVGLFADIVTITGFLGSNVVGTLVLAGGTTTFQTVMSTFSSPIDLLRVQVTEAGISSARIMDNFVFMPESPSAVPDSSSVIITTIIWAGLLLAGFAGRLRARA